MVNKSKQTTEIDGSGQFLVRNGAYLHVIIVRLCLPALEGTSRKVMFSVMIVCLSEMVRIFM